MGSGKAVQKVALFPAISLVLQEAPDLRTVIRKLKGLRLML